MHLVVDPRATGADPVAGSGRATLRHTRYTTYGCSLPGLTGFMAPGRAGPDHPRCLPGAARPHKGRRRVVGPACRGFPVQGTPSPPPSTARDRILPPPSPTPPEDAPGRNPAFAVATLPPGPGTWAPPVASRRKPAVRLPAYTLSLQAPPGGSRAKEAGGSRPACLRSRASGADAGRRPAGHGTVGPDGRAETKGFEPLDPGGSHALQACRLGRSRTSPQAV